MEGLIYRVQPYLENARLLYVYTPSGKKTLLAQGAQKVNHPNRILAQYLTHISFKDSIKSFQTLSEAKIINDFKVIKESFHLTKSAALILEIVDQFIGEDLMHKSIFLEMMLALSAHDISSSALSFALKILKPLGYALNLSADGRLIKGVSIQNGGIVYDGDSYSVDLDVKQSVYLLKLLLTPYQDLMLMDEKIILELKQFILKYYQYHLQTTLKNI